MTRPPAAQITRFRKRPVEVEAVQWTGDNEAELIAFTGGNFQAVDPEDRTDDPDMTGSVFDKLHSTWVKVYTGQWVIKGVKGEFYPIAPDVLAETYEPILSKENREAIAQAIAAVVCYTRCYACQFGEHPDPPEPHTWMDQEDAEHAGHPWPLPKETAAKNSCACPCAKENPDA